MKIHHAAFLLLIAVAGLAACATTTPPPHLVKGPVVLGEGQKLMVPAEGILFVPANYAATNHQATP